MFSFTSFCITCVFVCHIFILYVVGCGFASDTTKKKQATPQQHTKPPTLKKTKGVVGVLFMSMFHMSFVLYFVLSRLCRCVDVGGLGLCCFVVCLFYVTCVVGGFLQAIRHKQQNYTYTPKETTPHKPPQHMKKH